MIDLIEALNKVNLSASSMSASRVQNIAAELRQMPGIDPTTMSLREVRSLPESYRAWLKKAAANSPTNTPSPSTIRNRVYRLGVLLNRARAQSLLPNEAIEFDTGLPDLMKPKIRTPAHRRYLAFEAFREWCGAQELQVDHLTSESFRAYREALRSRLSHTFAEARYDDLIYKWRELTDAGKLPRLELPKWNEGGLDDYGLARKHWPQSIDDQFAAFEDAARGEARPGQKQHRLLSRSSLEDFQAMLSRYLGYLVTIRKFDLDAMSLVDCLGDSNSVVSYIGWHIDDRCGRVEREHHRETLRWFAHLLDWFESDPDSAGKYRRIAASLKTARARDPFPQKPIEYDDMVAAAMELLKSAQDRWQDSKGARLSTRRSTAIDLRDALLFALLICRPLRSRNLREMKLGRNLVKAAGSGWRLVFGEDEMKAKAYSAQFPAQLVPALELYLDEARPVLAGKRETREVFLSKSGRPLSPDSLWKRLVAVGHKALGISTNPHAFRYLVPTAYLLKHPDRAIELQALLGHAALETTLKSYIHVYSQLASRRVAATLRENCPSLRRLGELYA